MIIDLTKLYKGCPEEFKKDFIEMYNPASTILRNSKLSTNTSSQRIFTATSEAKEQLILILSKFSSLLNQRYEYSNKNEYQIKLKFLEDIGAVHKSIDGEGILKNMKLKDKDNFVKSYHIVNEFVSLFDFIIYQPVTRANAKGIKEINDYIKEVFKISSANCSILGHSIRSVQKSSSFQKKNLTKYSNELLDSYVEPESESADPADPADPAETEDDTEEDPEKLEDETISEAMDKQEPVEIKILPKKRGRPRKKQC